MDSKKILLIGDESNILDEGARVLTHEIYKGLNKRCIVKLISPRELIKPKKLKEIINYCPSIIHYLTGPKLRSIIILWVLSKIIKNSKTFLSTPAPILNKSELYIGKLFRPSKVLCQSLYQKNIFNKYGYDSLFLPNGVDSNRFIEVDKKEKLRLRKKYNIPYDKYVVLHIGHLSKKRNVDSLKNLIKIEFIYPLIVVPKSWLKPDKEIYRKIKEIGIDIRLKYYHDIQEIYQLANCYIFSGKENKEKLFFNKKGSASIEIPLTVLEAMACNLSIISTKFGGLKDMFNERNGFYFYSNDLTLLEKLKKCINNNTIIKTRNMILKYDWNNIITKLIRIYE